MASSSVTSDLPPVPREFRAAWVATVDNIDWPSRPGLSEEKQREELERTVDRLVRAGINVLIFQVRPSYDAVYPSSLEPSSWFVTGEQGKPIGWDPLQFALALCHARGIELHAWINPFRAVHPAQKGPTSADHVTGRAPERVVTFGRYKWADPGAPESRAEALKVVRDLLVRYRLDGVHIDDYFYPYPAKDVRFDDDRSYGEYRRSGGNLGRESWRRANVDQFVQDLYELVKRERPAAKFGISPFGIYRPNVPAGIKAGIDPFVDLAADSRKWLREGWCDYFVPQLYWKRSSTGQPFGKLLQWWLGENKHNRQMVAGLFTSQVGPQGKGWPVSEIVGQIEMTAKLGAEGHAHFSAKAVRDDWGGIRSRLVASPAWPGPPPRLSPPKPPQMVDGAPVSEAPVKGYLVAERVGKGWGPWRFHAAGPIKSKATQVAIRALGFGGAVSAPVLWSPPG
jgi:uncharacterized lipoprotein YddW (UPF0748 family)